MSKLISQVLPWEVQDKMEEVTYLVHQALLDCGLNPDETDMKKLHKEMKEKKIQVHKIVNGPESGYHILKNGILVKFIPAQFVKGMMI